ncbi:peptide MFS transporter [Govanella unica]|uniref:Peptide MFS transporter n=1 Tax=Govanella unica TaxID=2975056 RepID=A0A9X3TZT7_9PROT|nr:peptide MFS transporter [Govania unica]MDA5194801.1 peptide MFS transporter [Govania unica]
MKGFFGHPRGLAICFLTEMWERFSFYGMKALLTLYLAKHFLFSDQASYAVYGAYTALVYVGPVLGGYMADRFLGSRKAVTLGAILLVIGHFGMAFEGVPAVESFAADGTRTIISDPFYLQMFYLSLAFIIIGIGFLKPNISTMVGALYDQNDPRRDAGFTIFYMGINIGAAVASLLCGYLGEVYGWKYGFGLAGFGMLLGLLIFRGGQKYLEGHAEPPSASGLKQKSPIGLNIEHSIYAGAVASIGIAWFLVQSFSLVGNLLWIFSAIVVVGLLYFCFFRCTPVERDRMLVALVLMLFGVLFWALFEQSGTSLTLFADRSVNRDLWGSTIQTSQFQSLNPIFIVVFGSLFAGLWVWLGRRKLEPSTPAKFAFGIIQAGLGFLVLVFGAQFADSSAKVAMIWLVLAYLLHTTGELCLSPVGLSMITKLSVPKIVGLMMGVWFLSTAAAQYIASLIAMATGTHDESGLALSPEAALAGYMDVFKTIGMVGVGTGIVLLLLTPILRKRMHGIH